MARHRRLPVIAGLTVALGLGGCSASTAETTLPATPIDIPPATSTPASATPRSSSPIVGTVVQFSTGPTVVEVRITEDTATTRDFLSMLPMTLEFEDYGRREKISYPPRPLDYTGATGITPRRGDLFSYMPWGNLGFFYNAEGLGHSDDLVRLGTTEDLDGVMALDGQRVTIRIAE